MTSASGRPGLLPPAMRAYAVTTAGAAPCWCDVPCPRPQPGEVLVRVAFAALNPVDEAIAAGLLHDAFPYEYPVTLGRDFAGTVVAVGSDVTRFTTGDEVFGLIPLARPGTSAEYANRPVMHAGSFAEYVTVAQDVAIARRPASLGPQHAAALPLSGAAAHTALEAIDIKPGEVLLVVGATGGVGRYTVALAADAGATVIATGLPGDEPSLRELGAAHVVSYEDDIATAVRARFPDGIDGVVYLVPPPGFDEIASLVSPGGRIATTVHAADVEALAARGIAAANVRASNAAEVVERLAQLAVAGVLTPRIDHLFPAADIGDGMARLARGQARGKFVVAVGSAGRSTEVLAGRPDTARPGSMIRACRARLIA